MNRELLTVLTHKEGPRRWKQYSLFERKLKILSRVEFAKPQLRQR